MRVLVTGASGLLGNNLVRALLKQQIKPVCFVRKSTDIRSLEGIGCDFTFGNLENRDDVYSAVQDCDSVIHAASIFTHPENDYKAYETVNIVGTMHLVEAVLKYDLAKFIYISSANTIAPGNRDTPGIELNGYDGFHFRSHYLNSKYIAEQYVFEQVEKKGLNATILNPTFMLGSYDTKLSSGRLVRYALDRKWVWVPPGGKNFVHVEDVALVAVKALGQENRGEKYLIAGENYSYMEFFRMLNEITRTKRILIKIPRFILYLASAFTQLIGGKRMEFNLSNARVLSRYNYYSGAKSVKTFDIQYRPLKEALEDSVQWIFSNFNSHK
ncbi:MAG: NAD-dependent epimerase/dehydratase family protein [Cyclobacteriaceae bacterium]|nr:NAD-dependent epimerase/dehydratase family protein [Cyclobacteriaceae bacterium]